MVTKLKRLENKDLRIDIFSQGDESTSSDLVVRISRRNGFLPNFIPKVLDKKTIRRAALAKKEVELKRDSLTVYFHGYGKGPNGTLSPIDKKKYDLSKYNKKN